MVKCKDCPISEISLRRESYVLDGVYRKGYRLYCEPFDKHVAPHTERNCKTGFNAIKKMGPKKRYPFNKV